MTRGALVFVLATLAGAPAFAQIDIAGVWRPLGPQFVGILRQVFHI